MINWNKLILAIPTSVFDASHKIIKMDSKLRAAHFLGQCAHESNNFKSTVENLNYGEPALLSKFKGRFNSYSAKEYARKPERIANKIYASRMGNGPEESGDGWRYRGRGYIQLTGKDNYAAFSEWINDDCVSNPGLVASKYSLESAAFFFAINNLWTICDVGVDDETIKKLTRKINGGLTGIDERILQTKKFFGALNG